MLHSWWDWMFGVQQWRSQSMKVTNYDHDGHKLWPWWPQTMTMMATNYDHDGHKLCSHKPWQPTWWNLSNDVKWASLYIWRQCFMFSLLWPSWSWFVAVVVRGHHGMGPNVRANRPSSDNVGVSRWLVWKVGMTTTLNYHRPAMVTYYQWWLTCCEQCVTSYHWLQYSQMKHSRPVQQQTMTGLQYYLCLPCNITQSTSDPPQWLGLMIITLHTWIWHVLLSQARLLPYRD